MQLVTAAHWTVVGKLYIMGKKVHSSATFKYCSNNFSHGVLHYDMEQGHYCGAKHFKLWFLGQSTGADFAYVIKPYNESHKNIISVPQQRCTDSLCLCVRQGTCPDAGGLLSPSSAVLTVCVCVFGRGRVRTPVVCCPPAALY